jgi:methylated-DNA-[protein]-cysteine S-methyltransferase
VKKVNFQKLTGTAFQKKVWKEIAKISKGKTISYKELAKRIGKPKAVRAVANAVGANPIPISIPCHRIIRSDGSLGGYSGKGGTKTKRALLKKEGVNFM